MNEFPLESNPDFEQYECAYALDTNSPLPPNEKVFRQLIDTMIKDLFPQGKLPEVIKIHCKRSGPTTAVSEDKLTATLILKAFVRKDGYQ